MKDEDQIKIILENFFKSFRHTEIAKGCKLETITLNVERKDCIVDVEVDIIYGTEKAKRKKIIQYAYKLRGIIYRVKLEHLKSATNITVREKEIPKDEVILLDDKQEIKL